MIRSFAVVIILLFLTTGPVLAQTASAPPIATIVDVEGTGNFVMRAAEEGKTYPAQVNDPLYLNDVLVTGAESGARMVVVFIDDSHFTLSENTKFKADEYAYDDADTSGNKARYNILQGSFAYVSGLMTKKPNPDAQIATPYGTIGIRGTSLWGGRTDGQYGVYVDEGTVDFANKAGRAANISAGKSTLVSSFNAAPAPARTFDRASLEPLRSRLALKNEGAVRMRMETLRHNHPAMVAAHRGYMQKMKLQRQNTAREQQKLRQKSPTEKQEKRQEWKQQHKENLRTRKLERTENAPQTPATDAAKPSHPHEKRRQRLKNQ